MAKAKLTKGAVERFAAPPGKAQAVLWDTEVKGFGMRLSVQSNTRAYFLQYRVKGSGQERSITIGRHGDPWTPELARARAMELKVQMLGDGVTGVDPVAEAQRAEAERKAQAAKDAAQSTTLRQVMESYFASRNLRPATEKDIKRHCEKNLAEWIDQPVAGVTRNDCLAVFTKLSARAPGQANLCMTYWRALLNHAREMHTDENGEPTMLLTNPVTRLWKLTKPNPESPRESRIPLPKVGACWNALVDLGNAARVDKQRTAADWCRVMLLTGTRAGESAKLEWDDVDFDARTLTFRAENTKTGRALVLPMSNELHDLLKARQERPVKRPSNYVFPSIGSTCPHIRNATSTCGALTKIAGQHIHPHALRRTADDIALTCGISDDTRRMLLNHVGGADVHARHYSNNRAVLAAAAQKVADWIGQQALVAAGGNVIPFPAQQRVENK